MTFMEKFQDMGGRLAAQRHMGAVRDGIITSLPATLAGSVFLILWFLPIPGYPEFMTKIFGSNWSDFFSWAVAATFDMVGLIACLGISYRLAESYKVDTFGAAITSMCGYFVLVPSFMVMKSSGVDPITVGGVWSLEYTGARSLFVILVTAIVSTEIYRKIIQKRIVITLPDMVPPNVSNSFINIVPMFMVLLTMSIVRLLINFTPFDTIHHLVNAVITKPLLGFGSNIFGYSFLIFITNLFWTIGVHGPNAIQPILVPIEQVFLDANRLAAQTGSPLPYIISGTVWREIFLNIGGSGGTLAFAIMCLTMGKSEQVKKIGKLSLLPAIFQINEPIIFGIPIVLNPIMMLPFLVAPVVNCFVAYFAIASGLVARLPGIAVPWTMPTLVNGYLASGGKISVVILQLVLFLISAVIYFPFFKMIDNQAYKQEQNIS
ncbi:MAG: PTS sugar transporter subunit IIC [Brevinema sp.]